MTMPTLKQLNDRNGAYVARWLSERASLPEADNHQNDRQRGIISAMKAERGDAWLGLINRHGEERERLPLWQWDGGLVCNFAADFVVPRYDAKLEQLIVQREAAPYTGSTDDAARLEPIIERVHTLGGVHLIWT